VHKTPETPTKKEIDRIKEVTERIKSELTSEVYLDSPEKPKSWYNPEGEEILILEDTSKTVPLERYSHPVKGMQGIQQYRLYVAPEVRDEAERLVQEVTNGE
jgi:hypothetical protein